MGFYRDLMRRAWWFKRIYPPVIKCSNGASTINGGL
jgi:hypothetical protein